MIQIGKILKKVPIFRMLGKESIDFIVERLKFKTFKEGEAICRIGDPGEEMFIIISGETKICIYNDDDQEQVVATLTSGDYFGEMALLTGEPRSATVIATKPCEMFVLYKNDFDVILERYPSISLSMGKIVSQRLRETLKKAAEMPKGKALETKGDGGGPSGSLKDISIVDLISFCEANSLTGTMKVKNADQVGRFEFERGQLTKVQLGDVKDDRALDTMLGWKEGHFEISVKPLTLDSEEKKEAITEETKSILIVNNSLVVRKVIERAFRGLGYEVSSAPNIAGALDSVSSNDVDLIISDIKLADGNGVSFVKQVREKQEMPFIFITDDSVKAEFEAELKRLGGAELTKTHEVSEIVKIVENTIL